MKPWPAYVASFLANDMTIACRRRGMVVEACGVAAGDVSILLLLNWQGHISRQLVRATIESMLDRAAECRK